MPDDLNRRLGQILAEEEERDVDWAAVSVMSAELANAYGPELPPVPETYVKTVEKRRADPVLAHALRAELVRYLRNGSQ
ncbi:MAG: hypothetical protein ABIW03_03925 [Sphingomicrobium sp.]